MNIKTEHWRRWSSLNRERRREINRKWYAAHRLKKSAYMKLYHAKNREIILPKMRARLNKYKALNRDKLNAKQRESYRSKYASNPEYYQLKQLSRRALKKQATVNLRGIKDFVTSIRSKAFFSCYYCEKDTPTKGCNFDHIVPLSKGGAHSIDNLCATCQSCNKSKGNKQIGVWIKVGQQIFAL